MLVNGNERYELLQQLDFSSDRKRMSVVVRNADDASDIRLMCKGADDVVLERLAAKPSQVTLGGLETFARAGLRTLCVAERKLTVDEYESFLEAYDRARLQMSNRDEHVAAAFDLLERELSLLGITAIEDALQARVPETIALLREADIRFWMLTGDKYATALQIGSSCNLIRDGDVVESIRGKTRDDVRNALLAVRDARHAKYSLVIEGSSLNHALDVPEFADIALAARTVICCRVTPHQKALAVRMCNERKFRTLAIGDGGNDVGMIQEAHVGCGLDGREGKQAARAADYALAEFRFLDRLLLVHGQYSCHRTSFLAQYSFYKSFIIAIIQVAYGFHTGFSGTTYFNTFSLTTYNVIFTGLPIIVFGVQDKHLPESVLMRVPQLYAETRRGVFMNARSMLVWFALAAFQALILIQFTLGIYGADFVGPRPESYECIPLVTFSALVILQTFMVLLEMRFVTYLCHLVIWGTLGTFLVTICLVNAMENFGMYYDVYHLLEKPLFWYTIVLLVVATLGPVAAAKFYQFAYAPHAFQVLQAIAARPEASAGERYGTFAQDADNVRAARAKLAGLLRETSEGDRLLASV